MCSSDLLTFAGGPLTQGATGTMNIEIGGLIVGTEHDQLNITGPAVLGGTLNVTLISGFDPSVSDAFPILTFATSTGTFATTNFPPLLAGKAFADVLNANDFTVETQVADIVVNSNDDVDDTVCDATHCSLREAIIAANANAGVTDTITFSIPGAGVQTIQPGSVLPELTDSVIIDGYTQSGATANTDAREWLQPFAGSIDDLSISSDAYHGSREDLKHPEIARRVAQHLSIPVDFIRVAKPEAADVPGAAGQLPAGESAVL